MFRNLVIVMISVLVLGISIYVFKNRKIIGKAKKIIVALVFILWIFSIGLPNTSVLFAPLTPDVSGIVMDSTTNRPISNCNIKVYWLIESITPAGGHVGAYYAFTTTADGGGKFNLPRYQKALTVKGTFPIIARYYGGMRVVAYNHGYRYEVRDIDREASSPLEINIFLNKIDDQNEYLGNILSLSNNVFSMINLQVNVLSEEKKFLVKEYDDFYIHFLNPDYKMIETAHYFGRLASLFERLGEYQKAIDVLNKQIANIPEQSSYSETEIRRIKKLQKNR